VDAARVPKAAIAALAAFCAVLTSADLAMAQERPRQETAVTGRVIDATNREPVLAATVRVEGTDLLSITDESGRYHLLDVPPGPQVLRVEAFGYATARVAVTVAPRRMLVRDLLVAPSPLELEGITVTADAAGRARGELGTATVIDREAIAHQTAASLAGVLELVPGIPLAPPGLDDVQQMPLRAVPTSTGGVVGGSAAARDLASLGTLIILDGVPLSNTANLQSTGPRGELRPLSSAGGGIDLRRIPASTIDRVEVIRGVPSARYGELTQGAIIVDTRAGAVDPDLALRYDARTTEATFVGGARIFGERQTATLNLDLARTLRAPGLSDDEAYRISTQLSHRATLGGGDALAGVDAKLVLDSRIDFYQLFEDNPEQPDVRPGYASWTRDRGLRISERARLALPGDARLELIASLDHVQQRSYVQSLLTRPAMPFTDRLTEGRSTGRYIGGTYLSRVHLKGDPRLVYGRLELDSRPERLWFGRRLRAGLEVRREWNAGPGYLFDIEFPPQVTFNGVQGFYRPRRFDEIPPVATSALYLDDHLSRILGAEMLLNVQAGLRLDLLHEGTQWLSGLRDAVLQPRLNAEFAPRPWLRFRGGWGRTAKLPSVADLYPTTQYFDVVNVNWYADDPAERLAVLTTYIRDPTNAQLDFVTARKAELGLEIGLGSGGSAVSLVGFSDRISGGVGIRPEPTWLLREHFQLSDSTQGTGVPPEIIEPAAYADTVPVIIDRPANNLTLDSRGLELTASFPEIRPIRTRLELQGAWVRTRLEKEGIDFGSASRFSDFQLDERRRRTPYWEAPTRTGEWTVVNYRLVHHQPAVGLVVTATIQHWIDEDRHDVGGPDTLSFSGYMTRDAKLVPVPAEERGDPQYADLRVPRSGLLVDPRPAPADWLLSIEVSKTLPLGGRLSFYAFNSLDRVGRYGSATVGTRLFPAMRYGLEVTMPARALFGWAL